MENAHLLVTFIHPFLISEVHILALTFPRLPILFVLQVLPALLARKRMLLPVVTSLKERRKRRMPPRKMTRTKWKMTKLP